MKNLKLKMLLLMVLISFSVKMHAQEVPTVKSVVTYSCSTDALSIIGTDGSRRACWPYLCFNGGNPGVSGTACEVMCASSNDCQPGTTCDSTGLCVSSTK